MSHENNLFILWYLLPHYKFKAQSTQSLYLEFIPRIMSKIVQFHANYICISSAGS